MHLIWISNYVYMETLAGAQVGLTGHICHHVSLATLIETPCPDEVGQLVQQRAGTTGDIIDRQDLLMNIS